MKARALTILQINDLHGYVEPHPELVREGSGPVIRTLGGLARIATLYQAIREENPGRVLALDNGDTFHGTFLSVQTRGEALVPMMNALALDAMTAHWEFAYGPAGFRALAGKLAYPMLAANCFHQGSTELYFEAMTLIERGGLRIAVIGLACPIVDKVMPASFSKGVRFTIGDQELPHWIARARREDADLVVVLSHLGFPQDVKLAQQVDGIDVIVSGHTHNRMETPVIVNGAIIFQSGCHGSFIGRLDLSVENKRVVDHRHRLIAVDDALPEDPPMHAMIEQALEPHRDLLEEKVGRTDRLLHRYEMVSAPMDDVLLAAIASAAQTKIAFSNGWRYGAPIPPGPVTMNDLWNIVPTNPPISTVILTGREIREMLEETLERTFASDPFEQMGGYVKRCRGIQLYFKAENPRFCRIDRLFAGGGPVEPEQSYKVAFITAQGVPVKYGRDRQSLGISAVDALRNYFQSNANLELPEAKNVVEV